jgi:progressive ankylosis protein
MSRSPAAPLSPAPISLLQLWREFLPLCLSDVTMACGDPLTTTTLAHLPDASSNLAAVGIARTLAIFFESPIIMILHASNALAPDPKARRSLLVFMLLAGGCLSGLVVLLGLPPVFALLSGPLGVPEAIAPRVGVLLLILGGWPGAIALRRYYQGLLIYQGQAGAIAQASLARLAAVAGILALGYGASRQGWGQGSVVAGLSLIGGVVVEALVVVARRMGTLRALPQVVPACDLGVDPVLPQNLPQNLPQKLPPKLPQTLAQVWRFYWPLANSMLVVWGARMLLLLILARSEQGTVAIAAWSAAWGLVLVVANSTRMVQQIVIKYRHQVRDRQLLLFAISVGGLCSLLLLLLSTTGVGDQLVQGFMGGDRPLASQIRPVLQVCSLVPLLVATQNATQGFLISEGQTGSVNLATWLGAAVLLGVASSLVGFGGAMAAAIAMVSAITIEVSCLLLKRLKKIAP